MAPSRSMSNVLDQHRQQQIVALGRLGWSLRRIEETTGVRRETASEDLKAHRGDRGSPRADHATLRTGLHAADVNRPVDDWGKLLGDTAAVTALLDRLLHHAHVLKCGPRSWRTKLQTDLRVEEGSK
jgi:hypothetical protein